MLNREVVLSISFVLLSLRTEPRVWLARLHLQHTVVRFCLAIIKRVGLDTSDRIVEHAVVRFEKKFHCKAESAHNSLLASRFGTKLTVKSQAVQAILLVNVAHRPNVLTFDSRLAKHERLDAFQ